jgi:GTP-binding protein EngB required for normal cell division
MDFKSYEETKFEIAEIIRAAEALSAKSSSTTANTSFDPTWRELMARLAEDRFTIVFAGKFSRGKSSLINALLGANWLPTGIVPLTSVITFVRYGSSQRVLLEYEGTRLRGEIKLADLEQYVTERGNPGNVKRIRGAEIQVPAELLRRGIFIVDTPGLGSAILENSRTTEQFIPEIDVLVLVTSHDSPMSEDEIRFLRQASQSISTIFLAINKKDTAAPELRDEILQFASETARRALGEGFTNMFSVSARDGLAAKQMHNQDDLRESGVLSFETELLEFLRNQRSRLFLLGMIERVRAATESLPVMDAADLQQRLERARQQIPSRQTEGQIAGKSVDSRTTLDDERGRAVRPCSICQRVLHSVLDFMRQYQYDLSVSADVQNSHAQAGGFCGLHTWHYEQMASPRGVCTAYPKLLNRFAEHLRSAANGICDASDVRSPDERLCPACRIQRETEERAMHEILAALQRAVPLERLFAGVPCLPHFELLIKRVDDPALGAALFTQEAAALERTAEDMQRYAIKHDALRRDLASKEETESAVLGLQLLSGHKSLVSTFSIHDIL